MPRKKITKTLKHILLSPITDPCCRRQCVVALLLVCVFLTIPRRIHYDPLPIRQLPQPIPSEQPEPSEASIFDPFPFPDELKPQVEFWKKVFTEYTSKQILIHDDWYLNVVYEVIDLESPEFATEDEGWEAVKAARKKYEQLLEDLSKYWGTPEKMAATEQQVYALFKEIPNSSRFKKKNAKDRVRAQVGQSDRVKEGLIKAGNYLKTMKSIVAEYDLPENLVYLPLIESVFNPFAQSYLGAAGMWQFMRGTGKQYGLRINYLVDERKDPLKSTRAAAQLLAHNYKVLQSWPLAITAYNHGLQGVKNAVKHVGSDNIADIIGTYEGSRFGFASRNFYPEFLAAIDIGLQYTKYFGELDIMEPLEIAQVKLPDYVSVKTLEKYSLLAKDDIRQLNPALTSSVFQSERFLPKGYHLNILLDQKKAFETGYASIPNSLKYKYLPVKAKHRITKGQTLSLIAKKYNSSVKSIAKLNNITNPRRIRVGQILKIPGGYVSADRSEKPTSQKQRSLSPVKADEHRIQKGETLSVIAKKYHTSTKAIAAFNNITDPRSIRAGQILKIPGDTVTLAQNTKTASQSQISSSQAEADEHRVQKGETLSVIAKKYHTSTKAIAAFNNITDPRSIRAGQTLKIPGDTITLAQKAKTESPSQKISSSQVEADEHRVQKGETLSVIAKKYHTSIEAIAAFNNITDPRSIRAGQTLKIPGDTITLAQNTKTVSPSQIPSSRIRAKHLVQKGQTLSAIARKYNTSVKAISKVNNITNPRKIKAGQLLKIPEG